MSAFSLLMQSLYSDFSQKVLSFFMFSVGAIRGNTQHKCLRRFGGTKSAIYGINVEWLLLLYFFLDLFTYNETVDENYRVLKDKGVYILVKSSYPCYDYDVFLFV